MSTDYRSLTALSIDEVFSGRLEKFGISEKILPNETTPTKRCLVDGENWLWVYAGEDGSIRSMTRYGLTNIAEAILAKIHEEFEVDIVSEYEPQYWGFETYEAWEAHMNEEGAKSRDEFYKDLLAYVRGESNDIRPDTVGELYAHLACELVQNDSALLLPENKEAFMHKLEDNYRSGTTVTVTLNDEEIEQANQIAAKRAGAMRGDPAVKTAGRDPLIPHQADFLIKPHDN